MGNASHFSLTPASPGVRAEEPFQRQALISVETAEPIRFRDSRDISVTALQRSHPVPVEHQVFVVFAAEFQQLCRLFLLFLLLCGACQEEKPEITVCQLKHLHTPAVLPGKLFCRRPRENCIRFIEIGKPEVTVYVPHEPALIISVKSEFRNFLAGPGKSGYPIRSASSNGNTLRLLPPPAESA